MLELLIIIIIKFLVASLSFRIEKNLSFIGDVIARTLLKILVNYYIDLINIYNRNKRNYIFTTSLTLL